FPPNSQTSNSHARLHPNLHHPFPHPRSARTDSGRPEADLLDRRPAGALAAVCRVAAGDRRLVRPQAGRVRPVRNPFARNLVMTIPWNPSGDFAAVVDALETITHWRPGAASGTAIASAWRFSHSSGESIPADGQVRACDVVWQFEWPETEPDPRP